VDSLLAIKHLVFDTGRCTLAELLEALRANWSGFEVLQAWARNRCPKYGRDDPEADELAKCVMEVWTDEVWRHRTRSTGRQFRPGMLSWNYWVGDGPVLAASADGRPQGQFLSNPGQIVVDAHGTAHQDQSGTAVNTGRDRLSGVHGDQLPGDALTCQHLAQVARALAFDVAEDIEWFHELTVKSAD